jgi:hypothetical protein
MSEATESSVHPLEAMRLAIAAHIEGVDALLPDDGRDYEITLLCRHKTNANRDILVNSANDVRSVIHRLKSMAKARVIEAVNEDIEVVSA